MGFLSTPQLFAVNENTTNSSQGDRKETGHLQWKSYGEGITYQFQMASDSEFRQILLDKKCDKPTIAFSEPNIPGIYYVRIKPIAPDGHEYAFLPVQTYEVHEKLPPPIITSPEELAEVRDVFDIEAVWSRVEGAASYHVIVARDRAFNNIILDNPKIKDTSLKIRNLDFGTHFLKISSISKNREEGPFSATRYFMIVPHPVNAPR
jgi:hypothetical protein